MKMSKRGKRLAIFGTLSIFAIGYFLITLISYTVNYISLKEEEANLQNQLVSLQEQKENLKLTIERYNIPENLGQFMKENYLYSTDGEYIIKIEDEKDIQQEIKDNNNNYIYIASGAVALTFIFIIIKKRH